MYLSYYYRVVQGAAFLMMYKYCRFVLLPYLLFNQTSSYMFAIADSPLAREAKMRASANAYLDGIVAASALNQQREQAQKMRASLLVKKE